MSDRRIGAFVGDKKNGLGEEEGQEERPELVSAFPLPPAYFELYREGCASGPKPPEPMLETYHMFGMPYRTQDTVPDLLENTDKKVYATEGDRVNFKAELKKYVGSLNTWFFNQGG